MSDLSSTVAAAAEESSASTGAMASNIEETSTSIQSVSKATEQMAATIGEIAQNSAQAREISEGATAQTQTVHEEMRRLGPSRRRHRQGYRGHQGDRGPDEPARTQRDHRGRARWRRGQGIRGGRQRGQRAFATSSDGATELSTIAKTLTTSVERFKLSRIA
jgi:small-conductance mechanosensitive channel